MKCKLIFATLLMWSSMQMYAQDKGNNLFNSKTERTPQGQAIFIDLFPLMEGVWEGKVGGGLFYEKRIHNYFSLAGEVNYYSDFKDETAYSFLGHGRIYPCQTTLKNFFIDAGLGYRRSTLEKDNVHCLEISASAGWKFIIGKGFIIEPNVGYRQNIHTLKGHESQKGGITLNLGLGWAF